MVGPHAAHGCLLQVSSRQQGISSVLLQLVNLLLEVDVDGAEASVTVRVSLECGQQYSFVLRVAAPFQRSVAAVLAMLLHLGVRYFRVVHLLDALLGRLYRDGLLRALVADGVVTAYYCREPVLL